MANYKVKQKKKRLPKVAKTTRDYYNGTCELSQLPKGYYFRLPGKQKVYLKGEYDRSQKKYECTKTDDVWGNGRMLKGSTKVETGFTW